VSANLVPQRRFIGIGHRAHAYARPRTPERTRTGIAFVVYHHDYHAVVDRVGFVGYCAVPISLRVRRHIVANLHAWHHTSVSETLDIVAGHAGRIIIFFCKRRAERSIRQESLIIVFLASVITETVFAAALLALGNYGIHIELGPVAPVRLYIEESVGRSLGGPVKNTAYRKVFLDKPVAQYYHIYSIGRFGVLFHHHHFSL